MPALPARRLSSPSPTKWLASACLLLAFALAGCSRQPAATEVDPETPSPQSLFENMRQAYREATFYSDQASVRLVYRRHGKVYEDESPCAVQLARPNRIRARLNEAEVVSDGHHLFIRLFDPDTRDLDGQIVKRTAPAALRVPELYELDNILETAVSRSLTGFPVQLDLLLSAEPLRDMTAGPVEWGRLDDAQVEGHSCARVTLKSATGQFVFWIDRQQPVLRRLEFPAAAFAPDIAADPQIEQLQLLVDYRFAQLGGPIDASAFAFEPPPGTRWVASLVRPPMPLPTNLFGQRPAAFTFRTLDGKSIGSDDWTGRVAVLLWFNNHEVCRDAVARLDEVRAQFADDPRMVFALVCTEPSTVSDQQVSQLSQTWGAHLTVLRDLEAFGRDLFHIPWAPALVVIDRAGRVQIYEIGANPNLVTQLPAALHRVLAGEDVAADILERYADEKAAYEAALTRPVDSP